MPSPGFSAHVHPVYELSLSVTQYRDFDPPYRVENFGSISEDHVTACRATPRPFIILPLVVKNLKICGYRSGTLSTLILHSGEQPLDPCRRLKKQYTRDFVKIGHVHGIRPTQGWYN